MSTLVVEDVIVPDAERTDAIPPVLDVEYPCEICGKESGPYGGRGRKPKKCPEHRKQSVSSGRSKSTSSNTALAGQAADVLAQLNNGLTIGSMVVGLNATASAIANSNDAFRTAAYEALLIDPALCRSIVRGGKKGGMVGLMLAYGMLLANVIPVAKIEFDEKKRAREEVAE
jgi:hypothetical protein